MATQGSRNQRSNAPAPAPSRRGRASADLRVAVDGREDEFIGLALIAAGVVLGLAIYFQMAGPFGRGVKTVVGWFTGVGRYVVPVVLVSVGVALVRKGRSEHRTRLVVGWALAALSVLGLLHVVRNPSGKIFGGSNTLGRAGGWLGALVGEPLRSLLASPRCARRLR
jgi:DNA segregation ATPase FtsK/SpoIIIE, S-DNA-T family